MMNHFFNLELLDQFSYGPAAQIARRELGNLVIYLEISVRTRKHNF